MSISPMFFNEELEQMTDDEFMRTLIYQFGGHYNRPMSGVTAYESIRMAIMYELTETLRDVQHMNPLLKRALYLAELEDRCLSLDRSEPLEPKTSSGRQMTQVC